MSIFNETETKNWKYFLFKKKYPLWIYTIIVGLAAIIVYVLLMAKISP
ncbi:MAG: hypothetical protein IID16_10835 [Candidatus Marinimicrobia bacterium]|nr:hypothetical protein [Candidatus Neomarinimicrobiota bacterium]